MFEWVDIGGGKLKFEVGDDGQLVGIIKGMMDSLNIVWVNDGGRMNRDKTVGGEA